MGINPLSFECNSYLLAGRTGRLKALLGGNNFSLRALNKAAVNVQAWYLIVLLLFTIYYYLHFETYLS